MKVIKLGYHFVSDNTSFMKNKFNKFKVSEVNKKTFNIYWTPTLQS